jgi:uncharacterized protein YecE (DUF72 family)
MMKPAVFNSWYERSPSDFCFAIKGHRYITHVKRLNPPPDSIKFQHDNAAGLGAKLRAVLWQLPPFMHKDLARLEHFRELLSVWPKVHHVIEFRHASWFDAETASFLREAQFALCQSHSADWPLWNAVTTDLVFVRLHGRPHTYASNYTRIALGRWADRIRHWLNDGLEVHVYFDNDSLGYAPHNATSLRKLLSND